MSEDRPHVRLLARKDAIEAEIEAIAGELNSGERPPGLKGSLLDAEGFPRADLDLYRVRQLRQRHAQLQTDHLHTMKEIEDYLFSGKAFQLETASVPRALGLRAPTLTPVASGVPPLHPRQQRHQWPRNERDSIAINHLRSSTRSLWGLRPTRLDFNAATSSSDSGPWSRLRVRTTCVPSPTPSALVWEGRSTCTCFAEGTTRSWSPSASYPTPGEVEASSGAIPVPPLVVAPPSRPAPC